MANSRVPLERLVQMADPDTFEKLNVLLQDAATNNYNPIIQSLGLKSGQELSNAQIRALVKSVAAVTCGAYAPSIGIKGTTVDTYSDEREAQRLLGFLPTQLADNLMDRLRGQRLTSGLVSQVATVIAQQINRGDKQGVTVPLNADLREDLPYRQKTLDGFNKQYAPTMGVVVEDSFELDADQLLTGAEAALKAKTDYRQAFGGHTKKYEPPKAP